MIKPMFKSPIHRQWKHDNYKCIMLVSILGKHDVVLWDGCCTIVDTTKMVNGALVRLH